LLSAGMLLESLRIAASAQGRAMQWQYDAHDGHAHEITVRFSPFDGPVDPLFSYLTLRSVDRRPYRTRALAASEIQILEQTLGSSLTIEWHRGLAMRWKLACLSARATAIRLRIPEAFAIHREIIDWERPHSPTGIPAGAVGLDAASLKMMRWGMQAWPRMKLLNRFGGVLSAELQLDILPGLASGGFFVMRFREGTPETGGRTTRLLEGGQEIQRFWLTATRLGLAIQPALAVLAFAHYGETDTEFTHEPAMRKRAKALANELRRTLPGGPERLVFIGRIGEPKPKMPFVRSTRRSLDELIEGRTTAPLAK